MTLHDLKTLVEDHRRIGPPNDRAVLGAMVRPRDHGADFIEGDNNYTWWAAIGQAVRPRSVVEIGVRFGYSLHALLNYRDRSGGRSILAVDSSANPGETALDETFQAWFRHERLVCLRADSQQLPTLDPFGPFDLGSVDAYHTADGCYHDCGLVWGVLRPGGLMVVDDTIEGGCVREGVERFAKERGIEWAYLPSLRGIHLLIKP